MGWWGERGTSFRKVALRLLFDVEQVDTPASTRRRVESVAMRVVDSVPGAPRTVGKSDFGKVAAVRFSSSLAGQLRDHRGSHPRGSRVTRSSGRGSVRRRERLRTGVRAAGHVVSRQRSGAGGQPVSDRNEGHGCMPSPHRPGRDWELGARHLSRPDSTYDRVPCVTRVPRTVAA